MPIFDNYVKLCGFDYVLLPGNLDELLFNVRNLSVVLGTFFIKILQFLISYYNLVAILQHFWSFAILIGDFLGC